MQSDTYGTREQASTPFHATVHCQDVIILHQTTGRGRLKKLGRILVRKKKKDICWPLVQVSNAFAGTQRSFPSKSR